jgi:hypothetical protein
VTELPEDFCDLLLELADAGAEFVLVGGHAVAFHGHPRATKDMDVLIRADVSNAERLSIQTILDVESSRADKDAATNVYVFKYCDVP